MSVGVRDGRIDVLRGVSILLVMLHHFNIAYRLDDTALSGVFGWGAVHAVVRNGNYGVTMFFVISGFLITSNADRRAGGLARVNLRSFYIRRAARILPCLLLLLLVVNGLALGGVAIFQNQGQEGAAAPPMWLVDLASLTFWMNVLMSWYGWPNYALGVLWSLSVEEVFYLAFPLACRLLRRPTLLVAFWVAFIVIGPAYRAAHQDDESEFLFAYLACFDAIAIGCCTASLARRIAWRGSLAQAGQAVVAAGMAWLYLARPISQTNVAGVTLMALGTAVLLLGSNRRPSAPGALGLLRWPGRLSYELYLFHIVVLAGLRSAWSPDAIAGDTKLLLLVAYLVLSCVLAWIIARFYADKLNRMVRRRAEIGSQRHASRNPGAAPWPNL